jgi:chromosome segregation ATPase
MAYLKKNVNFGLFLLIIATLICFTAFSIYYQQNYQKLTDEYETKVTKIDDLVDTLNLEKTKLNQTSYQLRVKAEREQDLSTKYTELRNEKEQLETDLASLQSQLSQTIIELNQKTAELASTTASLELTQSELNDANREISRLESRISSLNDEIDSLQDQLNECLGS